MPTGLRITNGWVPHEDESPPGQRSQISLHFIFRLQFAEQRNQGTQWLVLSRPLASLLVAR